MKELKEKALRLINLPYFLPFCIGSAMVLRLLWIFLVNPPQVSDFVWYYDRAVDMAKGRGYAVNGIPTAYWPVGYPGFLGLLFRAFGPSVFLAKLANIAFYSGILILSYHISRRIFHSETAARITVLLLSFSPNHIAFTSILSTEILFAFLLLLGAVLFVFRPGRLAWLLLSGIAWGLATLTKTQAVFVPVIFLLLFSSNVRSFLKSGVTVYLALLLVITPWMARNDRVLGKPLLSTNGGIVLFIGNNPYANGEQIWDQHVTSQLDESGVGHVIFDGNEVRREEVARNLAIHYIMKNPMRTILLWAKKLYLLYRSDVDGFYYSVGKLRVPWNKIKLLYTGLRIAGEVYYLFVLALFFVSLPSVVRGKVREQLIGLAIVAYFTCVYLVFFAIPRYHFALIPWIAMYSGVGANLLFTSQKAFAVRASSD